MENDSGTQIHGVPRRRLEGWKEIAAYLGRDMSFRTAQRWEHDGLPVFRMKRKVFAYADELDRWTASRVDAPIGEAALSLPENNVRTASTVKVFGRLALLLGLIVVVVLLFRRPFDPRSPTGPHLGRLLARSTSENSTPRMIALNQRVEAILATPEGSKIYAASRPSRLLSIAHISDGTLTNLVLPQDFGSFVMSEDGSKLYVGQQAEGIAVIDTGTDQLLPQRIATPGTVCDFALTPDGTKLFIAMNRRGVWRALTKNGELRQLTDQICPLHVALDSRGERLFVSYECGGPTGRTGHDATEVFDTKTERRLGVVSGPPMVGGPPSVAPDGGMVLLDGKDACIEPGYDHLGCPTVPCHVFHLLRVPEQNVIKTIGRPLGTGPGRFIDHARVLFTGDSLTVMDTSQQTVLERWEAKPKEFEGVALLPALREAFVGLGEQKEVMALDAESPECSVLPSGLASLYSGDGTTADAIGGANLTSAGGVGFGPGRVGQAFLFDGKSGYLFTHWTGTYYFAVRDSSVAAYVKFVSVQGEMNLLEHRLSEHGACVRLSKTLDHHFRFDVTSTQGWKLQLNSKSLAGPNRWYFLSVTKNDEAVILYVNGVVEDRLVLSGRQISLEASQFPLYLGATEDHKQYLHGKLDEIMFYDRALSPFEVRRIFQLRESGDCKI